MEPTIAAVDNNAIANSKFNQGDGSLSSRLRSLSTTLGLAVTSMLSRIHERFEAGIPDSIDIDRISTRLGVVQRARSEGAAEYPPSSEKSISGGQLEIIAHFRELQRKAQRRVDSSADKMRRARERIDLPGTEGELKDIPSRCENEVRRMLAEWQSRRTADRADVAEQPERRSRNEKREEKVAAQSLPLAVQLAFLAALAGIGALLVGNTSAFGIATDMRVPPVWTVVVLSVVVILSSVVARAVSTSISHDGAFWKLRKWMRGGMGIAFAVLLSMFASHYLLAMTSQAEIGLSAAMDELSTVLDALFIGRTATLLPFEDWTIFAVVVAAALSAFVACYQPDTAPPVSDARRVPARRTRKERTVLLGQLRQVNMKIDRAEAEVTATLRKEKAAVAKYARLVDASRRLAARRSDYDYVLENACMMLLDRYRAENMKARTTAIPDAFAEHVCFRGEHPVGSAAFADEERRLEELKQGMRALESQAGQIRQELRSLNARAINAIEEATMS